jgi:organic radical activating enzyme
MKPCPYSQIVSDYQRYYLTWIINNICTNHCRYCPSFLHQGKNHHYDWQEAERFIDQVLQHHPKVHLVVSGGEPTVSPFLPALLKKFSGPDHYVGVSSNGVRRADYWKGLDVENLGLSYHPAFHDDQWIERAEQCQDYVKQVTVNLMMDPEYWDHCMVMYDQMLKSATFSVIPTMIVDWGTDYLAQYSAAQLQWLQDTQPTYRRLWTDPQMHKTTQLLDHSGKAVWSKANWAVNLINRRENNFSGWECDIGVESVFVQFDGSYRRGNCEQGGYTGWIRDGFTPYTESVICGYNECQCLTDISVPKRRSSQPIWRIKSQ